MMTIDVQDFWRDCFNQNPELKEQIDEIAQRFMFEFDTKENRSAMNYQFEEVIKNYISKKR